MKSKRSRCCGDVSGNRPPKKPPDTGHQDSSRDYRTGRPVRETALTTGQIWGLFAGHCLCARRGLPRRSPWRRREVNSRRTYARVRTWLDDAAMGTGKPLMTRRGRVVVLGASCLVSATLALVQFRPAPPRQSPVSDVQPQLTAVEQPAPSAPASRPVARKNAVVSKTTAVNTRPAKTAALV